MSIAKLSHRLTTQDALFLYGESESAPLHFSGLATFEGPIDFAKLREYIERRLPLLARFRQRVVFAPLNLAHPSLEDDPDFEITNHLFHHQLPEGSDEAVLQAAALRVFEPVTDRSHPLWEMHLFTGLEGERSAVLWRIHHCIVDGVSWVETLHVMLESEFDAADPASIEVDAAKPFPSASKRLIDAARDLSSTQFAAVRRIMSLAKRPPQGPSASDTIAELLGPLLRPTVLGPWNDGIITSSRSMASLQFPLAEVKAIRSAFGGTVNDVALAALGEGAARYLFHHQRHTRGSCLRIGCPVSVRTDEEIGTLGNRVSMMIPELHAYPMSVAARLKSVCAETRRIKASHEAQTADLLMSALDLVPPAAISLASGLAARAIDFAAKLASRGPFIARVLAPRTPTINFVATNVAGPRGPVYLASHRMLDYVGMIPLGGNLGYGVVIATYDQNLSLGMMAAPDLMPDIETMKLYVGEALEDLARAAKKQLETSHVTIEIVTHPEAA